MPRQFVIIVIRAPFLSSDQGPQLVGDVPASTFERKLGREKYKNKNDNCETEYEDENISYADSSIDNDFKENPDMKERR